MLVDATLVHVTDGQGIYPPTAMWADPDLDQAAAAMRTMVGDRARRRAIADDALVRMKMQPTPAETGKMIGRLLGIDGGTADDGDAIDGRAGWCAGRRTRRATLDALSADLRALQQRVDELAAAVHRPTARSATRSTTSASSSSASSTRCARR